MHAFVVSYSLRDATPSEHSELCEQLAPAVASVGGLASATCLTNPATGRHGAFFVFETKPDFDQFVASELFATISSHSSIRDLKAADYSISDRPTAVTRGPVVQRTRKEQSMRFLSGNRFHLRKVERRMMPILAAVAVLAAAAFALAGPAGAGRQIDPSVLQPPPPPGAVCRADGPYVICDTFLDGTLENEPVFDLPCGTVYETSADHRDGTRWYVDNLLVKRRVVAHLTGTWSLSPTGAGPTVALDASWNWWIRLAVPGDESTGELTSHGTDLRLSGPGLGGVVHDAGISYPDGTHHGIARFFDTPEAAAPLCAALA